MIPPPIDNELRLFHETKKKETPKSSKTKRGIPFESHSPTWGWWLGSFAGAVKKPRRLFVVRFFILLRLHLWHTCFRIHIHTSHQITSSSVWISEGLHNKSRVFVPHTVGLVVNCACVYVACAPMCKRQYKKAATIRSPRTLPGQKDKESSKKTTPRDARTHTHTHPDRRDGVDVWM